MFQRQRVEGGDSAARHRATSSGSIRSRRLTNRLTDEQVQDLIAAFEAGATRIELAKRYGIGRTSVAKEP